jgi:hypothetical protein
VLPNAKDDVVLAHPDGSTASLALTLCLLAGSTPVSGQAIAGGRRPMGASTIPMLLVEHLSLRRIPSVIVWFGLRAAHTGA